MKSAIVQMRGIFFAHALLLTAHLNAQSWEWATALGSTEDETCREIAIAPNGDLLWAGTFNETSIIGGEPLAGAGENDLILARFTAGGAPVWVQSLGSVFDDEVQGLAVNAGGQFFITGTYWLSLPVGPFSLTTAQNPKSIFLAKYNGEGEPLWAQSIDGSGSKNVGGLITDAEGDLFIAGYFSDTLFFADTLLIAKGDTDLFVAKFSTEGDLYWAGAWGQSNDARATCLAPGGDGGAIVGGFFNDSLIVDNTLLRSVSLDRDVFILRLDATGAPLWARQGIGAQDQDLTALAVNPAGEIFGTGFLIGVLDLGQGVSVQSQSGNPDIFLFRCAPDGSPLSARAIGNPAIQQSLDLALNGEQVVLTGFFQGNLEIDGQNISAGAAFAGLTAAFTPDLDLRWLAAGLSDDALISYTVAAGPAGHVYTGGTFAGEGAFDNVTLNAAGKNDAFIAQVRSTLTPSAEPAEAPVLTVFPNPTHGRLQFSAPLPEAEARVYDATGQLAALRPIAGNTLYLDMLPPGWYLLEVVSENKRILLEKILITP